MKHANQKRLVRITGVHGVCVCKYYPCTVTAAFIYFYYCVSLHYFCFIRGSNNIALSRILLGLNTLAMWRKAMQVHQFSLSGYCPHCCTKPAHYNTKEEVSLLKDLPASTKQCVAQEVGDRERNSCMFFQLR